MAQLSQRVSYRTGVLALAPICGLIDATCFLALGGVFAELMTGNLLLVALIFGSGLLTWSLLINYLGAILPFCLGAAAAGLVANKVDQRRARFMGYPLEFVLVACATALAVWLTWDVSGTQAERSVLEQANLIDGAVPDAARLSIVAILAFAMGIHNAMMRKHGVANVATNLMTLTLTALVSESRIVGGTAANQRLRALSILLFVAGAAVGALLLRWQIAAPLLLATGLFALALPALVKGRQSDNART